MKTFALISEGVTDQVVLEHIIHEVCGPLFDDGVLVNPLQPLRDATDRASGNFAGWELVLEYCEHRASEAFAYNDYVVIHLDTDQCEHPNYDVRLTQCGRDRHYRAILNDVIGVVSRHLERGNHAEFSDKLIFAISVHSIESWLLLYMYDRDEPKNSLHRLNRELARTGKKPIRKEPACYRMLARKLKRKRLINLSSGDHSLGHFLSSLMVLSR